MRKTISLVVALFVLVGAVAFFSARGFRKARALEGYGSRKESVAARSLSSDEQIAAAEKLVASAPTSARGYNTLAAALMQKARETGDFNVNKRVEEALARSLAVAPDNYDALKLRAKLLLTFHRFAEALEVARRAQTMNPRDHDNYGAMTDALVELGDYPRAVEAAQTMVDLRPDTSSYSRVSYLRWLHGDTKDAIDAMRAALEAASPHDLEKRAWCMVQLGDALLNTGKRAEAEREFDRALFTFPGYHLALGAKARARIAAGDLNGAVEIYKRALENSPKAADAALALGDLYVYMGRADEAERLYAIFESAERKNAEAENEGHHLVYFWADHDRSVAQAVRLARQERDARADIYTCDALAWSLFKNKQLPEAKAAIAEALRLGTRDARIHYHAGMIFEAQGDRVTARKHLRKALEINPAFDVLQARVAKRMLAAVKSST